jgi:hypothetical protein
MLLFLSLVGKTLIIGLVYVQNVELYSIKYDINKGEIGKKLIKFSKNLKL